MAKKKLTLEDMLVPKEEIPYDVPDNWCWVKLGNVVTLKSGINIKEAELNDEDKYLYVKVSDMNLDINTTSIEGSINRVSEIDNYSKNIIPRNSIIFPKRGGAIATNKKRKVKFPILVDSNTMAIIVPDSINFDYIYLWFLSVDLWTLNNGSSIPQINNKDIEPLMLPLPPLAEQERIVKRIESLFSKVDDASGLIDDARDGFEKRRASILERAFSGELTKKWREEHGVGDELTSYDIIDKEILGYDIPQNWNAVKLDNIIDKINYGYTESATMEEIGPKFLRITDIKEYGVDWSTVPYCKISDKDYGKYKLLKGDIVVARTGATTGKNYIIDEDVEAVFASYLIRFTLHEEINRNYISYFMKSKFYWSQIMEERKGIAQPGVNAKKLSNINIPIPSKKEQHEIVKTLDVLLAKESEINEISDVVDSIEVIKKSILAKAFRGELGSNDLDEGSSIELLKELI